MKQNCGRLAAILGVLLSAAHVQAQQVTRVQPPETVFQHGIEYGVGARALGMGGAYIGASDDYSAAYWNPAALTQIRRVEGFGTMSYAQHKDEVSTALPYTDQDSYARFNSLGFAYPIPTYRGSLVLSLGYHRVRSYDGNFAFSWFNSTPGDNVAQRWTETEEGGLNNWTFALATEVAPNFSVGAALNLWTGKNTYQFSFAERDELGIHPFGDARFDDFLESDYLGFNAKLAAMYHPSPLLRLGLTLATPTPLRVRENWREYDEISDDDGFEYVLQDTSGYFEYHIRSPLAVGAGAAVSLAGLVLSGNVEYSDWSSIRYTSEPPLVGLSTSEANDEIRQLYRETLRLRLGAEFTIPLLTWQARAGYFYDPTIYGKEYFRQNFGLDDVPKEANREFLTAGLGIFIDRQVRLDLAVMAGRWQEYPAALSDLGDDEGNDVDVIPILSEKISVKQALATIAFRF